MVSDMMDFRSYRTSSNEVIVRLELKIQIRHSTYSKKIFHLENKQNSFISITVIDLSIWTQIMNEMKNGLWNLFLVWDPNENNDNPILYKWFSAHLITITDGKGLSKSKSFIINSMSKNAREIIKPYIL